MFMALSPDCDCEISYIFYGFVNNLGLLLVPSIFFFFGGNFCRSFFFEESNWCFVFGWLLRLLLYFVASEVMGQERYKFRYCRVGLYSSKFSL